MANIYAVLPAKRNSGRLPSKNFLEFDNGRSLLELKIQQCLSAGIYAEIFVSSDSEEAQRIAERNGVQFLNREVKYCIDDTPWHEVIKGVVSSIPVNDDDYVQWTHVTNPLFCRFSDAYNDLISHPYFDSITTVTPFKHFMLNGDYIPINHIWGPWHLASQSIKPVFQMNLACSISRKRTMIENGYIIGSKPKFFEISMFEGIDIDTEEEFNMAKIIYKNM